MVKKQTVLGKLCLYCKQFLIQVTYVTHIRIVPNERNAYAVPLIRAEVR